MDALLNAGFLEGDRLADAGLTGPAGLLSLLVDELAYGVMVLTLEGKVLHSNAAARAGLARSGVLQPSGGRICDAGTENGKTLLDALHKVAEGKRHLITLPSETGSLTLAVIPLRGAPGTPTRAALIFARAAVHESLMLGFFARSHGLTATEEHVLGILCQGYSTPEIASHMKVAVSTIRSHVRSACAKTRSSGVRELVNRVAVLPPVTPVTQNDQVH